MSIKVQAADIEAARKKSSQKSNNILMDLSQCRHWNQDLPYRALVPIDTHGSLKAVRYQVAGSNAPACGAEKALRTAMKLHPCVCFFCKAPKSNTLTFTIDHLEPKALGGSDSLTNLVVACNVCNAKKRHTPIEAFNPAAAEEWLNKLSQQIEQRLMRVQELQKQQVDTL